MNPAEEQILRNQVAILGMLSALMLVPDDPRLLRSINIQLDHGVNVLKETHRLLALESEQGRTAHGYTP